MRRTLFTAAAVLSLLLCVATVVLWVRSYRTEHSYFGIGIGEVTDYQGVLVFIHWKRLPQSFLGVAGPERYWRGFGLLNRPECVTVMIPNWFLAVILIVIPAIGLLVSREKKDGQCHWCGYNLTGNTSGVCPECGTACTTPGNSLQKIP